METLRLGRTNLTVGRSGFGALPIQRIAKKDAVYLLQKARDNGITFFDTARYYSDSEEKLGAAFSGAWNRVVIATKTMGVTREQVLGDLATSLKNLGTDYVDILQLHNPAALPDPADPNSSYGALLDAKRRGLIRFIGISNHRLAVALAAAKSGLYDTVQFPLSMLSSEEDLGLIPVCRDHDVGLIAMKALSGGLVTGAAAAFAFLRQYSSVIPIWGIQRESELDEFLRFEAQPPVLDDGIRQQIEKERRELRGKFCRGCGYCMPCPVGIQINWTARMSLLLRRAPFQPFLTDEWRDKMMLVKKCTRCNACAGKCPYGLDTPALLQENLEDWERFAEEHSAQ
jgi:uncharacterized protein